MKVILKYCILLIAFLFYTNINGSSNTPSTLSLTESVADEATQRANTSNFIKALKEDKPDEAIKLLNVGIDVNGRDEKGYSPLHWAADKGHRDIVKLLIENKADVNAKDLKDSYTPLHEATEKGHNDIVKLLIENKADVNAKNQSGNTALHLAADKGYRDIVELLIENNADVNAQNDRGNTALSLANYRGYKDISDMLTKAGAIVRR